MRLLAFRKRLNYFIRRKEPLMKKAIKIVSIVFIAELILSGIFLIIHRRVIAAWLFKKDMPMAPDWHPNFFGITDKEGDKL